ncbi:MAG: Glu/Leu/Phe/Val dehydrogenase dimerization domain-containing protein [Gemmatimonadota bacterium]
MHLFDTMSEMGHEQIAICHDKSSGYRGIIAIHDTTLGPALGGTRFWNYASDEEAIIDALRLARGMTYKNAVAGLNLGGGKAVIIGDNRTTNRELIFRAHGRFVESLGGRYVTAEDVGTSTADMDFVHMETDFVAGLANKSGDPSPVTARGVFRAIEASAKWRWGSPSLDGKTVVVQGLGNVGYYLCRELNAVGATLVVTDIRPERVERVVSEFKARAVDGDAIYSAKGDIFAPCALGAILNDDTIPKLQVEIVCGGANNQLHVPGRHGAAVEKRGILYAPDFVANAGGVINVYGEVANWTHERALRKADEIFDTMLGIYQIAKEQGILTYDAADKLAERRIAAIHGLVKTWPLWPRKS